MRPRAPSLPTLEPGWCRHIRRRPTTVLRLTVAVALCAVVTCAVSVPSLVFGAEGGPPQGRGAPAAASRHSDSPSPGLLLVTLPWGSGEGQVGLVRPAEGLTSGPEALAVAPDGRIAVLDSVNHRVLLLDSQGRDTAAVTISLAEPRFLAVDDERLHILDCDADRQAVTIDWTGAVLDTTPLPDLPDVVTALFATPEGPCVEVAHDSSLLVHPSTHASPRALAGRPVDAHLEQVAKVSYAPGKSARIRIFHVDRGTLASTQKGDFRQSLAPGRDLDHLVSVDGDGHGGLIIGARLLDKGLKDDGDASIILTRLTADKNGSPVLNGPTDVRPGDELLLADQSYAYVGRPYVVAPDGRVLQPVAGDDGYSIFVHSFAGADTADATVEVQP
ncbi:MAG: hypothetical protein JW990_15435 [Thermoleophilia bacterium]|nr:hypothetical protein [Thermoleophilia bacterium]